VKTSLSKLIILLTIFLSSFGHAQQEYELYYSDGNFFSKGIRVPNYFEIIEKLESGDTVVFSNRRKVILGDPVDLNGDGYPKGQTTRVFEIEENKVIRLNAYDGMFNSADHTLKGYKTLVNYGVPIVKVFKSESIPGEMVIAEKVKIHFTSKEFFREYGEKKSLLISKAAKDLVEFVKATHAFSSLGDDHVSNIVYTNKGWIILDWNNRQYFYSNYDKYETIASRFDRLKRNEIARELIYKLKNETLEERFKCHNRLIRFGQQVKRSLF